MKLNNLISFLVLQIAKIFYHFNFWSIRSDYEQVLNKHQKIKSENIPLIIFEMLIIAEDRKYFNHKGIDIFAIFRAIISIFKGKLQGASTITQQYVRVLSGYYEISLKRKIREIFLTLLLNKKFNKSSVLNNYLKIAYFGYGLIGLETTLSRLKYYKTNLTIHQSASIVARLKYPDRKSKDLIIETLRKKRTLYLAKLYKGFYSDNESSAKLSYLAKPSLDNA